HRGCCEADRHGNLHPEQFQVGRLASSRCRMGPPSRLRVGSLSASAMARLEEWLPRARRFCAARAQNPAYRPALPLNRKMPASVRMPAFPFWFFLCCRAYWCVNLRMTRALVDPVGRRRGDQPATISNECVSSAVLAIMIEAEQYLSCDRLMARSTVAGL